MAVKSVDSTLNPALADSELEICGAGGGVVKDILPRSAEGVSVEGGGSR